MHGKPKAKTLHLGVAKTKKKNSASCMMTPSILKYFSVESRSSHNSVSKDLSSTGNIEVVEIDDDDDCIDLKVNSSKGEDNCKINSESRTSPDNKFSSSAYSDHCKDHDIVRKLNSDTTDKLEVIKKSSSLQVKQSSMLAFISGSSEKVDKFVEEKIKAKTHLPKSSETSTKYNANKRIKTCPFYKWIPGTKFTVDAFSYGQIPECSVYFLSHFHYDHYGGLTKKFKGQVYCSQVTGNFLERRLKLNPSQIHRLPMEKEVLVEGVKVFLLEANHCPGAVMFLFELADSGGVHLHTGDFRAEKEMLLRPPLAERLTRIDTLFLDTTYCSPQYTFPPQSSVIKETVSMIVDYTKRHPNTLVVCGTYSVGKERIFQAVADALKTRIFATREKSALLRCLDDPGLTSCLCSDLIRAGVHLVPMAQVTGEGLSRYLVRVRETGAQWERVLGLKPTGWEHRQSTAGLVRVVEKSPDASCRVLGVPYSEHSSYTELRDFVCGARPRRIVPTVVRGSTTEVRRLQAVFETWLQSDLTPGGCL